MFAARFLLSVARVIRAQARMQCAPQRPTNAPDRASSACSATGIAGSRDRFRQRSEQPRAVRRRRGPARNRRWPRRRAAGCRCLGRQTPKGRFCTGKSLPARLADSTQLFTAGSCVSLSALVMSKRVSCEAQGWNRLSSPCQHSKYCSSSCEDSSANFVGRQTNRVSNINASVPLRYCGFNSPAEAFSNVAASGP